MKLYLKHHVLFIRKKNILFAWMLHRQIVNELWKHRLFMFFLIIPFTLDLVCIYLKLRKLHVFTLRTIHSDVKEKCLRAKNVGDTNTTRYMKDALFPHYFCTWRPLEVSRAHVSVITHCSISFSSSKFSSQSHFQIVPYNFILVYLFIIQISTGLSNDNETNNIVLIKEWAYLVSRLSFQKMIIERSVTTKESMLNERFETSWRGQSVTRGLYVTVTLELAALILVGSREGRASRYTCGW